MTTSYHIQVSICKISSSVSDSLRKLAIVHLPEIASQSDRLKHQRHSIF